MSSTRAGASDSIPSTAWPSAILSSISRSSGWRSASSRALAPDLVGQQQLAARRRPQPLGAAPTTAGRRSRTTGSPRPRRPRTRPGPGAPRSAGRRRRCRRGPRTRHAARPGRPGGRRLPASRRTTSSSSTSSPLCSATGSRSARPLTCGCSTERTGATMTRTRASLGRPHRGGPAGAARRAAGRRCRTAATAARAAGSPRPGRPRRTPRRSGDCTAAAISSVSRAVAVTTRTRGLAAAVRLAGALASAAVMNGRSAAGAVRSSVACRLVRLLERPDIEGSRATEPVRAATWCGVSA